MIIISFMSSLFQVIRDVFTFAIILHQAPGVSSVDSSCVWQWHYSQHSSNHSVFIIQIRIFHASISHLNSFWSSQQLIKFMIWFGNFCRTFLLQSPAGEHSVLLHWRHVLYSSQLQQVQSSPQSSWRTSCWSSDWSGQLWDPQDWWQRVHHRDQRLLHC